MAHASDRRRWPGGSVAVGGEAASKTQIYALIKARSQTGVIYVQVSAAFFAPKEDDRFAVTQDRIVNLLAFF